MTLLTGKPRAPDRRPTRAVLIVDDVPEIGAMYRALMRQVRNVNVRAVVEVRSAAAIEALATQRFDLVITDLRMPGPSGMEVIAAAKRLNPGAPIILMSGYLEEAGEVPRDLAAVIAKPLDVSQLLGLLETLLTADPSSSELPSVPSEGNGR